MVDLVPNTEFEVTCGAKERIHRLTINGHPYDCYPLIERDPSKQESIRQSPGLKSARNPVNPEAV